jgi:predicted ATP-grasp superfamily ATP-dependent carboligase
MTSNILLTGARSTCALELARHLHAQGHRVIACDTSSGHVARFSNAVDKFLTIPSPRYQTEGFVQALLDIIEREKINWLIPIWEEVMYLSLFLNRFPNHCQVFCSSFHTVHTLHHKWLFIEKLKGMGILAPQTFLLRSQEELDSLEYSQPYVLKACYSRGSRKVIVVEPGKKAPALTISKENPWIAQEYIEGKKYCSYSVCHAGKVKAHAAYPVIHTMDGSSCLSFESIEHESIKRWVFAFAEALDLTGHAAFDFIETPEGDLYAIECNPRATSGIHLFRPQEGLAHAFLNQNQECVYPKVGNTQQILAGMLMFGWKDAFSHHVVPKFIRKLITTKDVVFSRQDPRPFFCEPFVLASYLWKSRIKRMSIPVMFTQDLDWDEMLQTQEAEH